MTNEPTYWVESHTAVKTGAVIAYGVWHNNGGKRRECVHKFSVHRKGEWPVALHLANMLRDDLNNKIA
jgi:hypothetical protein